jgi:hypothetical protein
MAVLALSLGSIAMPAAAIVYCKSVGVPKGCAVRAVVAPGVGAPGVGVAPAESVSLTPVSTSSALRVTWARQGQARPTAMEAPTTWVFDAESPLIPAIGPDSRINAGITTARKGGR